MKRSGIQRRTPLRTRAKRRPSTAEAALHFKTQVCAEPCIGTRIDGHVCDGPLQAMHVIPKQTLRRRGLNHLRYDPLNGISGCLRIHTRHDNKLELIDRDLLPQRCLDFAAEHGLLDVLDRHWPARSAMRLRAREGSERWPANAKCDLSVTSNVGPSAAVYLTESDVRVLIRQLTEQLDPPRTRLPVCLFLRERREG